MCEGAFNYYVRESMLQFLYEKGIRTPLTSVSTILVGLILFCIFLIKEFFSLTCAARAWKKGQLTIRL